MEFIISSIVNFSAVVFILWKFGRKPAKQFVINRSEKIRDSIQKAQELFTVAEEKQSKWQAKWESAGQHATNLLEEAKKAVENYRARTIASANQQAKRIEEDAKLLAQSEVTKARHSVQTEIVDKSIQMAAQFMNKSLGEGERRKLVVDSLEMVGAGGTR